MNTSPRNDVFQQFEGIFQILIVLKLTDFINVVSQVAAMVSLLLLAHAQT
jgi:hypothetical protein